ncbi:hypothetical protein ACHAP3_005707 [Botrytis cinerea]
METISLNVDFRKEIPNYSVLRKRKGYFYIRYCLELHLDGESVTFVVKTKDKNENPYSIEIDDLGTTISSVILTGDCPKTREELGSEILNSTTTDKNSSTSTCRSYATSSSSNIGINTSPDDASSQASNFINPVTPTSSFVDPLENIECDSRNLKSLLSQNHKASKKLEDPFSFNHSQPKSALFQPARRPRKGLESKEALTSETPQVLRPKTVDDIGLPIIDDSQDTDELSLLVWLLLSPPVPEESIVVRCRRVSFTSPSPVVPEDTIVVRCRGVSFTSPSRFE